MVLAAAAFAVVSIVHFGVDIPVGFTTLSDSFSGAAPPEAVIAAVVAIGATAVLTRRTKSRAIALGTTSFAVLGTVYGLNITVNSTRTGDVAYHLSILATLLIIVGLLLLPWAVGVQTMGRWRAGSSKASGWRSGIECASR
jgi:hypothetical protein